MIFQYFCEIFVPRSEGDTFKAQAKFVFNSLQNSPVFEGHTTRNPFRNIDGRGGISFNCHSFPIQQSCHHWKLIPPFIGTFKVTSQTFFSRHSCMCWFLTYFLVLIKNKVRVICDHSLSCRSCFSKIRPV